MISLNNLDLDPAPILHQANLSTLYVTSSSAQGGIMNFTLDDINQEDFFLYKKESKSRKATGYHIYMRCAFRSWDGLSEGEKMALMKPALRQQIMSCLDESNLLPSSFNRETDDPFQLAPFSSSDLRGDLRSVVGFHWRNSSEERKLAWKG